MKEIVYKFLDGTKKTVMVEDDIGEMILNMNKEEKKIERDIKRHEVLIYDLKKEEYIRLCVQESEIEIGKLEENEDEIQEEGNN